MVLFFDIQKRIGDSLPNKEEKVCKIKIDEDTVLWNQMLISEPCSIPRPS